jgi:hypothetical protein
LFFSAPFFCRHPAIVGQSGGFDFVPAILPDTATKRRRFIYFLIHFKRRQKYYQGPFPKVFRFLSAIQTPYGRADNNNPREKCYCSNGLPCWRFSGDWFAIRKAQYGLQMNNIRALQKPQKTKRCHNNANDQ